MGRDWWEVEEASIEKCRIEGVVKSVCLGCQTVFHGPGVTVSMCSKQMAEEVLRGGPGEDQQSGFEGMEVLAQAIELGMLQW